jgi:hypothetical protein
MNVGVADFGLTLNMAETPMRLETALFPAGGFISDLMLPVSAVFR